jgi:hypothetical protein
MVRIDLTKVPNSSATTVNQTHKPTAATPVRVHPLQERDNNAASYKALKQSESSLHNSSSTSVSNTKTSPTMRDLPTETWFCYLMKQLGGHCKNEANIKVAREPYADVDSHNRGDVNDKATKPAKGLWQVEMIIGPFPRELDATQFRMEWMLASRGMSSRRDCGIKMTMKKRLEPGYENLFCFDKRLVPYPLNTYLITNGMDFLCVSEEAFEKLVAAVENARKCMIGAPIDISLTAYAFDSVPRHTIPRLV